MRDVAGLGFLLALAVGGCGSDEGGDSGGSAGGGGSGGNSSCGLGFLGDEQKPVELKVTVRGADLVSKELANGGEAPMILPPQGGRVIFVGVRVTNLSPCGVELSGTLRDKGSGETRLDARVVNLKPTGDGWGTSTDSDISTFSMIPTCPNQWASTDVFGHTFELTVSVTDKGGRTAEAKLDVVPTCAEPANQAECTCQCTKGYTLGQTCN